MMTTEEILAAFEDLRASDPAAFYTSFVPGEADAIVRHPFVSGSFELGLVIGAKYALEHWAAADLKDKLIEEVRKMRQLKKKYFVTLDLETLTAAKSSEARVDELLADLEIYRNGKD